MEYVDNSYGAFLTLLVKDSLMLIVNVIPFVGVGHGCINEIYLLALGSDADQSTTEVLTSHVHIHERLIGKFTILFEFFYHRHVSR